MGTRLFAFNTLAGAKRSGSGVVEDTTAGRFDSAYVANAIKVPSGAFIDTPPLFDGSASVTELFTRFDIYGQFDVFAAVWLEFYNSSGTLVAYLTAGAGAADIMEFDQWNGSGFNSSTHSYSAQTTGLYTVEVRLKCGASGTCDIYLNGTLWMTFAVNQASVDNIAKVRMYSSAGGITSYYSQVMGADFDIRDRIIWMSKLASRRGNHYTDGTGAVQRRQRGGAERRDRDRPADGRQQAQLREWRSITVPVRAAASARADRQCPREGQRHRPDRRQAAVPVGERPTRRAGISRSPPATSRADTPILN
jgi:hypothetical protein